MQGRRIFTVLALGLASATVQASAQSTGTTPSVAQAKIPTRSLGAVTAVSTDSLGARVAVRPLSSGKVLVNDVARQRVLLFDASLKSATVVMDSGSSGANAAMPMAIQSAQLIPYLADSSLYVDVSSMSLLVLDPNGKVGHVMALPKPRDAIFLAMGSVYGVPMADNKGRLVYRGVIINPPKPPDPNAPQTPFGAFRLPEQPDSAPIVRADFDTRSVDTLMTMKALKPGNMSMSTGKDGNFALKVTINPLDTGDEWAILTDGTIAVVRAHDYHIDWLDPDGTKRSTPKMPFDWKRLSDEQKQFKIDSLRPEMEKQLKAQGASLPTIPTPNGPRRISIEFDFVPLNKIPDYEPPISPGSVRADLDNNLWIVPRTAVGAGTTGLLYDVVNRKGEIIERVSFPKGRVLAGFGPGGVVYLLNTDGKSSLLERASIR